jgi:hypothetical protein
MICHLEGVASIDPEQAEVEDVTEDLNTRLQ